jgi:hypothetical protein
MYRVFVTLTNETAGHIFGEWSEEAADWYDTPGKLYRVYQKEYGRCKSRVYVDTSTGVQTIGWYFESRQEYEDSRPRYNDYGRLQPPETYIRGAWITYEEIPEDSNEEAAA